MLGVLRLDAFFAAERFGAFAAAGLFGITVMIRAAGAAGVPMGLSRFGAGGAVVVLVWPVVARFGPDVAEVGAAFVAPDVAELACGAGLF